MNIHEYQAKQLLAKYGVAVPKGAASRTLGQTQKPLRGNFNISTLL